MTIEELSNTELKFLHEDKSRFGFSIMSDGDKVLFNGAGDGGQSIAMLAAAMDNNPSLCKIVAGAVKAHQIRNHKSQTQS